jgi:hypothetical protein
MNAIEAYRGTVLVNLYPGIETPDGFIPDRTKDPKYKVEVGANQTQFCEEDWVKTTDNQLHFVAERVFDIVGADLVQVIED